jgi:glycosyltransferase involved in cell wall biosynthesis
VISTLAGRVGSQETMSCAGSSIQIMNEGEDFEMSKSPLVSVIIPAFNAEQFLKATLASVQAQTYRNIEIILIDDGSTDSTGLILEEAAQEDPRVRVLHQANLGVAAARNRGLTEARGELIAPLDADDVWHPQYLALQVAQLQNAASDVAVSYAWFVNIDANGMFTGCGSQNELRHKQEVLLAQMNGNFIGNASSTVIRRKAIEKIGGYDVSLHARGAQGCEDQALYIALAQNWNYTFVPKYLIAYRRHVGSMSQDHEKMVLSQALLLSDLHRLHPDLPGLSLYRAISTAYEGFLSTAIRRKQWRKVKEVINRCWSLSRLSVLALVSVRLPVRIVGFCMRTFRNRIAAPEARPRAYDVFASWSSEQAHKASSALIRTDRHLTPDRGPI